MLPLLFNRRRQSIGRRKLPSARPIRIRKIRIAKFADRAGSILFPPRPQIAARKTTEYRRAPRLRALALQRVEDLFDSVHRKQPLADSSWLSVHLAITRTNRLYKRALISSCGMKLEAKS